MPSKTAMTSSTVASRIVMLTSSPNKPLIRAGCHHLHMPAVEMELYSAVDRFIETLDLPVLVPVHHVIMRMAESILIARRNDNLFRPQTT